MDQCSSYNYREDQFTVSDNTGLTIIISFIQKGHELSERVQQYDRLTGRARKQLVW